MGHFVAVALGKTFGYGSPSLLTMKPDLENENTPGDSQSEESGGAVAELTPEQINDLAVRAAKADEHWERLLRITADFENFKKRAAREKQEAIKFANESLLQKLIPVIDNFDMALTASGNATDASAQSLRTGITMIHGLLKSSLAEAGLEEIDATGQPFDPNLHEAVSEQESADTPEGHVMQQLRKGYRLKERLIRPATVVVAKKSSA